MDQSIQLSTSNNTQPGEAIQLNKESKAGGRPSKFDQIDWDLVRRVYEAGLTDKEVCKLLKIDESTLTKWKQHKEEFFTSIKKGKMVSDEKVVRALFERATGYSHPEEKIFQEKGEIIRAETTKHYPPDPLSMIFWLKNRQPELWRDRQEVEFTKPMTIELKDYRGKQIEAPAAQEAVYKEIGTAGPVTPPAIPEGLEGDDGEGEEAKTGQENAPKV